MRRTAAFAAVELLKDFPWGESSGCFCKYFKLSDRIGLKTYHVVGEGFGTYTHQLLLSRHDLAPKCWGFSEYNGVAAYFTEHCEDALVRANSFIDEGSDTEWRNYREHFYNELDVYCAKCQKIGVHAGDLKMANMGWKGKRLLAIDIGNFCRGDWFDADEMFCMKYSMQNT